MSRFGAGDGRPRASSSLRPDNDTELLLLQCGKELRKMDRSDYGICGEGTLNDHVADHPSNGRVILSLELGRAAMEKTGTGSFSRQRVDTD